MNTFNIHKFALTMTAAALMSGCSNVRLQTPEELGRVVIDSAHLGQSKRLCTQQNDPALRLQCEQQAKKEFEKFKIEQQKAGNAP